MPLLALPQELKDHIFSYYVSNEDPRHAVRTRLVCRMYSSLALSIAQPLSTSDRTPSTLLDWR